MLGPEELLWDIYRQKEVSKSLFICWYRGQIVLPHSWRVIRNLGVVRKIEDCQIFNLIPAVRRTARPGFDKKDHNFLYWHLSLLVFFRNALKEEWPGHILSLILEFSLCSFEQLVWKYKGKDRLGFIDRRREYHAQSWEFFCFHRISGPILIALLADEMSENLESVFKVLSKLASDAGIQLSQDFLYSGGNPGAIRKYVKENLGSGGEAGKKACSIIAISVFVHMYGTKLRARDCLNSTR